MLLATDWASETVMVVDTPARSVGFLTAAPTRCLSPKVGTGGEVALKPQLAFAFPLHRFCSTWACDGISSGHRYRRTRRVHEIGRIALVRRTAKRKAGGGWVNIKKAVFEREPDPPE